MALHVDSSVANQYIDCGSAAAIDDWTSFTLLSWCRATTLAADGDLRRIGIKSSTTGNAKDLHHAWLSALGIPQDCLRWRINRATTAANAESVANTVVQNEWMFVVGTYSEADGPRIYKGTLTALATEVSYNVRTVGIGGTNSDADGSLRWGQRVVTPLSATTGLVGDIATGLYINRILSLAEIQSLQFRFLDYMRFTEAKAAYIFGYNGTGTQPDLSGNGNAGTVTGATVADHVPLGPFFGWDAPRRYAVVAGPTIIEADLNAVGVGAHSAVGASLFNSVLAGVGESVPGIIGAAIALSDLGVVAVATPVIAGAAIFASVAGADGAAAVDQQAAFAESERDLVAAGVAVMDGVSGATAQAELVAAGLATVNLQGEDVTNPTLPVGTVPVRYLVGELPNVVPVETVLVDDIGVVSVREFVGPANVVPVREAASETPRVRVRKV